MGKLEDRLERIREGAKDRIPEAARKIMHDATEALEASGLAERAVGVGDAAPGFQLADPSGEQFRLEDLRAEGPVVLTFFRGHW